MSEHFIYEVNLNIEKPTFEKHQTWLIEHFHDMVTDNGFESVNIYTEENFNLLDDNPLRYTKISAQYVIRNESQIAEYLERFSVKMRSQVTEKLEHHYSIHRRILKLKEHFKNPKE